MRLAEHMTRGLIAAWTATSFRSYGLAALEKGKAGAWRSFSALIMALPLYALALWLEGNNPLLTAASASLLIAIPIQALGWALFAGLMWPLAQMLGLTDNYPRFVNAYNWSRVMVIVMLLPLALVSGYALVSIPIQNIILVLSWGFVGAYKVFVVRHGLGASWVQACLIVLLDVILFWNLAQLIGGPTASIGAAGTAQ